MNPKLCKNEFFAISSDYLQFRLIIIKEGEEEAETDEAERERRSKGRDRERERRERDRSERERGDRERDRRRKRSSKAIKFDEVVKKELEECQAEVKRLHDLNVSLHEQHHVMSLKVWRENSKNSSQIICQNWTIIWTLSSFVTV